MTEDEIRAIWGCAPNDVVTVQLGDGKIKGTVDMVGIDTYALVVKVEWLDGGNAVVQHWFYKDRIQL